MIITDCKRSTSVENRIEDKIMTGAEQMGGKAVVLSICFDNQNGGKESQGTG
jgi:hypothetical protein